MTTYYIKRMMFEDSAGRIIARGLTLEDAQEHCSDPETSSKTASQKTLDAEFKRSGSRTWFDGYDEE